MTSDEPFHVLHDMLRAAKNAVLFTAGLTELEFSLNEQVQYAVTMALQIIGESAAKLIEKCPEFVAAHAELPVHQMRGMRNRIAHGYFTINQSVVWDTARNRLPQLVSSLEHLLKE